MVRVLVRVQADGPGKWLTKEPVPGRSILPADLFTNLDEDWAMLARSPTAAGLLRRWGESEPALAGFESMDALLGALRGRTDPAWRDRRMLALLRIAATDRDARRVVLQVVRPALSCVAYTYFARWGAEDVRSEVVTAALERIASFPTDRRQDNLAGHIVQDVRHSLFKRLERQLAFERSFSVPVDLDSVERELAAGPDRTAADQVASIIAEAVRVGRIKPRHAQLVIDSRLAGVPIEDIATAWNRPAQTVRRMRQRVERALADAAVA